MPPSEYSNRSRISFTTPKVWAKETCRLLHHYWLPKKRFDMRSIFISANHPRSRHRRASPQWSSQRRRVRQGTSWYPCSSLWSTVGSEQRTETRLQWSCPTNTSGQFNNFSIDYILIIAKLRDIHLHDQLVLLRLAVLNCDTGVHPHL